jgi:hypothetical protein
MTWYSATSARPYLEEHADADQNVVACKKKMARERNMAREIESTYKQFKKCPQALT